MPEYKSTSVLTFVMFALLLGVFAQSTHGVRAAEECLSKPGSSAPPGQHWYYRVDHASGRHCWRLAPTDLRIISLLKTQAAQRFGDETGYEVHERLRALVNVKPSAHYYPVLPAYGICDGKAVRGTRAGATPCDYGNRKRVYRGCFGGQYDVGVTRLLARRLQVDESILLRSAHSGAGLFDRAVAPVRRR